MRPTLVQREKRFCRETVSLICCLNELHIFRCSHAYQIFWNDFIRREREARSQMFHARTERF